MLIQSLIVILFSCVSSVMSIAQFIDEGQRAEFFELSDHEVATFKINMPDNEFILLKKKAVGSPELLSIGLFFDNFSHTIEDICAAFKQVNFNELYPENNVNELLPELKIDRNGFSQIDINELVQGFNYNTEDYLSSFRKSQVDLIIDFLQSNPNFKLMEILSILSDLPMAENGERNSSYINFLNLSNMYKLRLLEEGRDSSLIARDFNNRDIYSILPQFKTKNATLVVEFNKEQYEFKKITISIGGQYSRFFSKPGYNLKIRGNENLFGRTQFKLRSDISEPTFLRTKLVADIHNRLGITSISASYIQLYINEEYMGLYIIYDTYKQSWIEFVYGEKNTSSLYKCDTFRDFSVDNVNGCINENDDVTDQTEWIEFVKTVEQSSSADDLEDIFEIDHFLKEIAIEYLTGGWDHIIGGHNFYLYKQPNGKWIYLTQDFDHDMGQGSSEINTPFTQYTKPNHLIDVLILKDSRRFDKILGDIVKDVFNPDILYPHIDELKEFIRPYIIMDKTPNEDGIYPGRLNYESLFYDLYTIEQWEDNIEFTTVNMIDKAYGIKYWILYQYRYICNTYQLNCNPYYLDDNYNNSLTDETKSFETDFVDDSINTLDDYNYDYKTDIIDEETENLDNEFKY